MLHITSKLLNCSWISVTTICACSNKLQCTQRSRLPISVNKSQFQSNLNTPSKNWCIIKPSTHQIFHPISSIPSLHSFAQFLQLSTSHYLACSLSRFGNSILKNQNTEDVLPLKKKGVGGEWKYIFNYVREILEGPQLWYSILIKQGKWPLLQCSKCEESRILSNAEDKFNSMEINDSRIYNNFQSRIRIKYYQLLCDII